MSSTLPSRAMVPERRSGTPRWSRTRRATGRTRGRCTRAPRGCNSRRRRSPGRRFGPSKPPSAPTPRAHPRANDRATPSRPSSLGYRRVELIHASEIQARRWSAPTRNKKSALLDVAEAAEVLFHLVGFGIAHVGLVAHAGNARACRGLLRRFARDQVLRSDDLV